MPERSQYPDLKIMIEYDGRLLEYCARWRGDEWVQEENRWKLRIQPNKKGNVDHTGFLYHARDEALYESVKQALIHEAHQMIKGDHHAY